MNVYEIAAKYGHDMDYIRKKYATDSKERMYKNIRRTRS